LQYIAPKQVPKVLKGAHDKNGHFGSEIVLDKIRERFFWPTLYKDVADFIQSCNKCAVWAQRRRATPVKALDALYPFELVQADLLGPFDISARGNVFALNLVCRFTRYYIINLIPSKEASTVAGHLDRVFDRCVDHLVVITDSGNEFKNDTLRSSLKARGIYIHHTGALSHGAMGAIESIDRIGRACLANSLTLYEAQGGRKYTTLEDWDQALSYCALVMNQRYVRRIGYNPTEVMFGYRPEEFRNLEHAYLTKRRQEIINALKTSTEKGTPIPDGQLFEQCYSVMEERRMVQEEVRRRRRRCASRMSRGH
jgi:hypothetical protein